MDRRKIIWIIIIVVVLVAFFMIAKNASPDYFKELGLSLPLPVFTFIIAIIDGFNPCTIWVLTFLLVLMISVSSSRKRIFTVGLTFIIVVYGLFDNL